MGANVIQQDKHAIVMPTNNFPLYHKLGNHPEKAWLLRTRASVVGGGLTKSVVIQYSTGVPVAAGEADDHIPCKRERQRLRFS